MDLILMNFMQRTFEAKKLFDVNSHSIDDLDSELNGKTKNEIIKLIEECFIKSWGESFQKVLGCKRG